MAAFITHRFRRKITEGEVVKIPKDCFELYNAVGHYCTSDFHKRVQGHVILSRPEGSSKENGLVTFKAALPTPYQNHYLSHEHVHDFARSLESFFWIEFKEFIFLRLQENVYKDHALKEFMEEFGITESMYPIGHFRRQLHRMKVKGLKQKAPELPDRIHIRIPNPICWRLYRINKKHNVSHRELAKHYPYSRRQIERIIANINSLKESKTVAKTVAE